MYQTYSNIFIENMLWFFFKKDELLDKFRLTILKSSKTLSMLKSDQIQKFSIQN